MSSWGGAPPDAAGARPNWYPDPAGVADLRYWNGWAWTPGVVIGGRVSERPLPDPRAMTVAQPADSRLELPLRAAGLALAGFVVSVAVSATLSLSAEALGAPNVVAFLLGLAGLWSGLMGSCWLASRRFGTGHVARDFGLTLVPTDVSWGLLVSVVARVAGLILLVPIILLAPDLLDQDLNGYERVAANDVAVAVALAVVATLGAPLVEELFFRGLLQGSLVNSVGAAGAIALQAALFGLAHFNPLLGTGNVIVLTVVTAGGVVFGIAARWRGLGTSVVAHVFFNMLAMLFLLGRGA